MAEAHRAHRLRRRALLRVARGPGVRPQPAGVRRRRDPHRRRRLRHRFFPGARRLGTRRLRVPGGHQPPHRRHLQEQLDALWPRPGRGGSRGRTAASRRGPRRPGDRTHRRRREAPHRGAGRRHLRFLRDRRLGPRAPSRRARRHRPHARPRRRDRELRTAPGGLAAKREDLDSLGQIDVTPRTGAGSTGFRAESSRDSSRSSPRRRP